LINHGKWTTEEDQKLLNLAKEHEYRNWDKISDQLNTNRTAFQWFFYFIEIFFMCFSFF